MQPSPQTPQVEAAAAAYLPAPQLVQIEAPAAEYVPAGHGAHVAAAEEGDPIGPYVPAAHKEPEHVEAPEASEYLPAAQSRQVSMAVAPSVVENLPAAQEMQPIINTSISVK